MSLQNPARSKMSRSDVSSRSEGLYALTEALSKSLVVQMFNPRQTRPTRQASHQALQ